MNVPPFMLHNIAYYQTMVKKASKKMEIVDGLDNCLGLKGFSNEYFAISNLDFTTNVQLQLQR